MRTSVGLPPVYRCWPHGRMRLWRGSLGSLRCRSRLGPWVTERARVSPCLARVSIDQIEQLVIHGAGCVAAIADGHGGAVFEVIAHQQAAHATQCLLHGCDLDQDVCAVALLVDHGLQAAHLSRDAVQAAYCGGLELRIDGDGHFFAGFACGCRITLGRWFLCRLCFAPAHDGLQRRRRRLFSNTLRELNAMAALATAGDSKMPKEA